MQVDDKKIDQIIEKIEYAIDTLGKMDSWLPQAIHNAIDHALHGHSGTLDRVDIDRMTKERKEDEKMQEEINSLHAQISESQKQTKEIAKQTRYVLYTVVIAIFGLIFSIILQSDSSLLGLLK